MNSKSTGIVLLLIVAAVMVRLISLPIPNFAPVAAIALFGAAFLPKKSWAFAVTLGALLLSDTLLHLMFMSGSRMFAGYHSTMWAVYGAMAIVVLIGLTMRKKFSIKKLIPATLLGSIVFFIVTNFAVWLGSGVMYPKNLGGLVACYTAAIPFFHYTLLGDLFFVTILFGSYYLIKSTLLKPAQNL